MKNFTKSCHGVAVRRLRGGRTARDLYTWPRDHDGVLLLLDSLSAPSRAEAPLEAGRTWTHTTIDLRSSVRMLLSFQRPSSLFGEDFPGEVDPDQRPRALWDRRSSIARWTPMSRPRAAAPGGTAKSMVSPPPDGKPSYSTTNRRKRRLPTRSTCRSARSTGASYSRLASATSPSDTAPWSIRRRA